MRYPIRHQSHVRESASFQALERCLPSQWVVRHITERDYGIDCLVEIVSNTGELRGDLVAVQLKSAPLKWRTVGGMETASLPHVKTSTINYWMRLPLPTLVVVHDHSTGGVHACNVRDVVRRKYSAFQAQKSMALPLKSGIDLRTQSGLHWFLEEYTRERRFEDLASGLLDLISNRHAHRDFIEASLDCDCFLPVEPDDVAYLFRLYLACWTVSHFCGGTWRVRSFEQVVEDDRRHWGDDGYFLHESSRDGFVKEIGPAFVAALRLGVDMVFRQQQAYWEAREPMLFACVDASSIDDQVESLEHEIVELLGVQQAPLADA